MNPDTETMRRRATDKTGGKNQQLFFIIDFLLLRGSPHDGSGLEFATGLSVALVTVIASGKTAVKSPSTSLSRNEKVPYSFPTNG